MRKLLVVVFCLSFINLSFAKFDPRLDDALINLDKAIYENDEDELKIATKKIKKLIEDSGSNGARESFLAIATAKKASFVSMPWTKLKYANEASKIFDNAIKNYPDDITLRIGRSQTYMSYPDILNKDSLVNEDIRYLLKKYEQNDIGDDSIDEIRTVFVKFYLKQKNKAKADEYMALIKKESNIIKAKRYYEGNFDGGK